MDKKNEDHDDSYEIVFRNGALKRLQDIAKKLDIPKDIICGYKKQENDKHKHFILTCLR